MAKSPSHGRDMGALYLLFWLRNYPHDRGTRPLARMPQVLPVDLAPVCEREDIRAFPFHEEGTLVCRGHVAHELRIAEPTIRDNQRRRQLHAASAESRHASIEHDLHPVQFVAARRPRTCGVWPTDGKVDGDDQLALADHHDKQHTVNTREHPVFLATPPGA